MLTSREVPEIHQTTQCTSCGHSVVRQKGGANPYTQTVVLILYRTLVHLCRHLESFSAVQENKFEHFYFSSFSFFSSCLLHISSPKCIHFVVDDLR